MTIMDDFKNKILSLLNRQGPKIPSMGFSDANYHFPQAENLSINSKTVAEANRPADQDILESIADAYFSTDEEFDVCRFELEKLSDGLDCEQIQRDFKELKQQHQVVSKKVLQLILEHQNSCNEEFKEVLEIVAKIKETLQLCRTSRKELGYSGHQVKLSLGILSNFRKRKLAQNLLNDLNTIKYLHSFEKRVQNLLNAEDYCGAILELKKCQRIATKYRHFSCVAALTYKLQETLENTDTQLERILAQTCFHFDSDRYEKLLLAYSLLDKSQISMIDTLHVHYITAIYNTSFNVVHSYVTSPDVLETSDTSGKNPYKVLCQSVSENDFIPCLIHLCRVLFKIVLSYHQLVRWHNQENDLQDDSPDLEVEHNMSKQKLEHNVLKIWDDVQRKVSSLLLNADLAHYKFDQFVQVLGVVHKLIQVGEEFCSSKSDDLQESIRKQSVNYFKSYHAQRLEELRIFLENEMWEICPVKISFDIAQLQEFKSLRSTLKNFKLQPLTQNVTVYSTNSTECCSSTHSNDGSSFTGNYFIRYIDHGTPFDRGIDDTVIDEDILMSENDASGYFSDDSDEENEELKKDFVDEFTDDSSNNKTSFQRDKKSHHNAKVPILTNTTLSVLRQMGKYLQMSRLLKPIAPQIIICMNQLYDFYLYSVHSFFTSDLVVSSASLYSKVLTVTLKKISDNLIVEKYPEGVEDGEMLDGKITKPKISQMVDMKKPETLHGLTERIIAVESVIFLAKQYEFLQEYMEYLVPTTNKMALQQFFSQNITSATDLRKPVYMAAVANAFDLRQILIMMSKINWEIKEVMSQHNRYIDMILREIQIFTLRLEDIASKIPIPMEVYGSLWENIAHIITHTLVQGFSEAKKCSNGGRALMQLDFTQFLTKFEKITSIRPMPHKEYVEHYVKAYYLPEAELEKWIKEHNEYSTKHLQGLVSCSCQNNKKTRQRLLQIIESFEKQQER